MSDTIAPVAPADERYEEARADLAKRYLSAVNNSYEATMGDYSIGSINRASERLQAVRAEAAVWGLDESDLIVTIQGPFGTQWILASSEWAGHERIGRCHGECDNHGV